MKWTLVGCLAALSLLGGCGGGGGSSDSSGGGPAPAPATPPGAIARVTVDIKGNKAIVTPLTASDGRAAFTGSSFTVETISVFDDPSSLSVKSLELQLKNQTGYLVGPGDMIVSGLKTETAATIIGSHLRTARASFNQSATTNDGPVQTSSANGPYHSWVDTDGAIYTTGLLEGRVRKTKDGFVGTIRTGLSAPAGITGIPGTNFLAVAESNGNRITIIDKAGAFITRIGPATGEAGNINGVGEAARFSNPRGIAADSAGNLFVADRANNQVRKIANPTTTRTVTTVVTGQTLVSDVSVGTINGSEVLALAVTGTNAVSILHPSSAVPVIIAGGGASGFADGQGNTSQFASPLGIKVANNAIYVADFGNARIRVVAPNLGSLSLNPQSWQVATISGNGSNGALVGVGLTAAYIAPSGVTSDDKGDIYATDSNGNIVNSITLPAGFVWGSVLRDLINTNVVAGAPVVTNADQVVTDEAANGAITTRKYLFRLIKGLPSFGVSDPLRCSFEMPISSANGAAFFSFLISVEGSTSVSASPEFTDTLLGSASVLVDLKYGAPVTGSVNGGPSEVRFGNLLDVATDSAGRIYVSDKNNRCVRLIDVDGKTFTIAGNPSNSAISGGNGAAAGLGQPTAIEVDPDGERIWVTVGNCIRQLTLTGTRTSATGWNVATVAGDPTISGLVNASNGLSARFFAPAGMYFQESTNRLYIADNQNHAIRFMEVEGTNPITTLAGGTFGDTNGTGGGAQFKNPNDIDGTPDGQILVAEQLGRRIRKVTVTGTTFLLSGSATGVAGDVVGNGPIARFSTPTTITVNDAGIAYVGDLSNNDLKGIFPNGNTGTCVGVISGFEAPEGFGDVVGFDIQGIDKMPGGDLVFCVANQVGFIRRVVNNGLGSSSGN